MEKSVKKARTREDNIKMMRMASQSMELRGSRAKKDSLEWSLYSLLLGLTIGIVIGLLL